MRWFKKPNKKVIGVILALLIVVTSFSVAMAFSDEQDRSPNILGGSGERLGGSGKEKIDTGILGSSQRDKTTLGISLFSGSSGFVLYDGVDVGVQGDFTVTSNADFVQGQKPLTINAKFNNSPILGSNPDQIKNRQIAVKINPGMQIYSAPGLKASGATWVQNLENLDANQKAAISKVEFIRNTTNYDGVYQVYGGEIIYTVRDGVDAVSLPIFTRGEYATLLGGNISPTNVGKVPLVIPLPVEVTTQATSAGDPSTIVIIDEGNVDSLTVPPALFRVYHNVSRPIMIEPGGTGSGSVATIYTEGPIFNYQMYIKNVKYVYSVPDYLTITNVTARPSSASSTEVANNFAFDFNDVTRKLTLTFDSGFGPFTFDITATATSDAPVGDRHLIPIIAESSYDGVFTTGNKISSGNAVYVQVVKPFVNIIDFVDLTYDIMPHDRDNGMISISGFRGRNGYAKELTDQRIRMAYDTTKLDVRVVRMYSETTEFKNIKITSTDGQTYKQELTKHNSTVLNIAASDIFTGDVGIAEAIYEMPKLSVNGNLNTDLSLTHLAYFGYLKMDTGFATSTITVTEKDDIDFTSPLAKTNTTTTKITTTGKTYVFAAGKTTPASTLAPGSQFTTEMSWAIRPDISLNANTQYYLDDFTFYFREIPNVELIKNSVKISVEGVEIDPTTYVLGETTDNQNMPVFTVTAPGAKLTTMVPIHRPNSEYMRVVADYTVNKSSPSFTINMQDYMMAIPNGTDKTNTFAGSGVIAVRQNTFDVDESGITGIGNTLTFSPINVGVGASAKFSASTSARLNDNPWGTYDPANADPVTNGTISLNPNGKAQYRLQVLNESGEETTNFTAYVPIPKIGGDLGDGLNAKGGAYDAAVHMQGDDFGWTVNLKNAVQAPITGGNANTYKYEYATEYATDHSTAALISWTDAAGVSDWTAVKTVRISSAVVKDGSFDTFVFDIGFDTALAEAQAGNTNIYSARFIGTIGGASIWTVSEPVAIILKTGSASGKVWIDKNRNNTFDPGEALFGVVVDAYEENTTNLVATTTTNSAGEYVFDGLDSRVKVDIHFTNPKLPEELRFGNITTLDGHITGVILGIEPTASINNDAKLIEPFTITFDGNGTAEKPAAPLTQKTNRFQGETVKDLTSGLLPTAGRSGYTFEGWTTTPTGRTKITGDELVTGNATYYAIWDRSEFAVTFHEKGGTATTPKTIIVPKGKSVGDNTTPNNIFPTTTYTGYKHSGWTTSPTGTAENFLLTTIVTGDVDVYAVWRPEVTLDVNGGESIPTKKMDVTINGTIGGNASPNNVLPTATRGNYVFAGWGNSKDDTTPTFDESSVVSAPKTVFAVWRPVVTLDVNGGDTIGTKKIDVAMNGTIGGNTPPNNVLPTTNRTNYTFGGWATTDNAKLSDFSESTPVTTPRTVYAVWTRDILEIDFDGNGGAVPTPDKVAVEKGNSISENPAPHNIMPTTSFEGYEQDGWGLTTADTVASFFVDTPVSAGKKVFAVWRPVVTFDLNGVTTTVPTTSISTEKGKSIGSNNGTTHENILPTPVVPTGYVFVGWGNAKDDTTATFTLSDNVSAPKTVHAVWRLNLDFDANQASSTVTPSTITAGYGKSISENDGVVAPNILPTPTDVLNYAFGGWGMNPTDTKANFTKTDKMLTPQKVYGVWRPEVKFDLNGLVAALPIEKISVEKGKSIGDNDGTNYPKALPVLVPPTGYVFAGWGKTPADTVVNVLVTDIVATPKTVYAVWRPVVTLDVKGGKPLAKDKFDVSLGGNIAGNTAPNNVLPIPTKDGFIFGGWGTTDNALASDFSETTTVTTPTPIYAIWRPVVTLDVNSGNPLAKDKIDVSLDGNIAGNTAPNNVLPKPTKDGYVFGGWAVDKNATVSDFSETTTVTAPLSIYAVWKPVVTFSPNGGDPIAGNTIAVEKGKTIGADPTQTMPTATRQEYKFLGWAVSATGKTPDFTEATKINESMTVYAVWEEVFYTVTVNHYKYGYNENMDNAVLSTTDKLPIKQGTTFTASLLADENYNFVVADSDSITIASVMGDTTVELYYKHVTYEIKVPGNTEDGSGKVLLDVNNKYPFKDNSITLEKLLRIADVEIASDKVTKTKVQANLDNAVVTSDDFEKLDYSSTTPGYSQSVNLTFAFDSGQEVDVTLEVRMVDSIPPTITLPKDQRFYYEKAQGASTQISLDSVIPQLKERGLLVTDNYDKDPSFNLTLIEGGEKNVKWNHVGEYAFYVNAQDSSGNNTEQKAIIVVMMDASDGYEGTTKPDKVVYPGSGEKPLVNLDSEELEKKNENEQEKAVVSDYIGILNGTPLGNLPATGAAVGVSTLPAIGAILGIFFVLKKKKKEEETEIDTETDNLEE